ncbi:hypothetical protein AB0L13_11360 [Saccharopolyspora shandongensis]|uniref:hypothetical protein n=1 Tax=Saccharopolyspora shandongensis TaxID=418495 RepID=UPI003422D59B
MSITADQVRAAHAEGYAAGHALQPAMPNPYAGEPLPPWRFPRDPDARRRYDQQTRERRALARVWLTGWDKGHAAYAALRSGH